MCSWPNIVKLVVFVAHPEFVSFVVVLLLAAGLALGAVLVRTVGDSIRQA